MCMVLQPAGSSGPHPGSARDRAAAGRPSPRARRLSPRRRSRPFPRDMFDREPGGGPGARRGDRRDRRHARSRAHRRPETRPRRPFRRRAEDGAAPLRKGSPDVRAACPRLSATGPGRGDGAHAGDAPRPAPRPAPRRPFHGRHDMSRPFRAMAAGPVPDVATLPGARGADAARDDGRRPAIHHPATQGPARAAVLRASSRPPDSELQNR